LTLLSLIFPICYFAFIGGFRVRTDQILLPLTLFLFVLAAGFLSDMWRACRELRSDVRRRLSRAALVTTGLIVLALPLSASIAVARARGSGDARETARIWINANLPQGATIGLQPYAPYIDSTRFRVLKFHLTARHLNEWIETNDVDYVVFSESSYGRFYKDPEKYRRFVRRYDTLFEELTLVKVFHDNGPEIRIYSAP
jgi:hypothetical protein